MGILSDASGDMTGECMATCHDACPRTCLSSSLQLVELLNTLYSHFDALVDKVRQSIIMCIFGLC